MVNIPGAFKKFVVYTIYFIDTVSLASIIYHYNIAQLIIGIPGIINCVILHCTSLGRFRQMMTLKWKTRSVCCNKVFLCVRDDDTKDFYDMNETLAESAPAYSTVAKWQA